MTPCLFVPIHLDVLLLETPHPVLDTAPRVHRMPYAEGNIAHNHDIPATRRGLDPEELGDVMVQLEPGAHLHWALPDALTHHQQVGHEESSFPRVPDRWLIVRQDAGGGLEAAWVVDSDALHDDADRSRGPLVPLEGGERPFGRLGGCRRLEDVPVEPNGRLERLTAVAGGTLEFAAIYANCRNVFGMHDPTPADALGGTVYTVIGWFSDEGDPLQEDDDLARLALAFDWVVEEGAVVAERTLFYARASVGGLPEQPAFGAAEVAVGTDAADALATVLPEDPDPQFAERLVAIHYAGHDTGTIDLARAFAQYRHTMGFRAVRGPSRWELRPRGTHDPERDESQLVAAMAELDSALASYRAGWRHLESVRAMLFADWCRYQSVLHPSGSPAAPSEPGVHEICRYLLDRVAEIDRLAAQAGLLVDDHDDSEGGIRKLRLASEELPVPTSDDSEGRSLAEHVDLAWQQVAAMLEDPGLAEGHELLLVPGTRFWAPSTPVVALRGDVVQATDRHGMDGRLMEGRLLCRTATLPVPDPHEEPRNLRVWDPVLGLIDRWFASWERGDEEQRNKADRIAFRHIEPASWHPILVEWRAELDHGHDPSDGPNHALEPYGLALGEDELRTADAPRTVSTTSHQGRTLLSRAAPAQFAADLETLVTNLQSQVTGSSTFLDEEGLERFPDVLDPSLLDGLDLSDVWEARTRIRTGDVSIQTFPLDGLHDDLRMLLAGGHMEVSDPLALPGSIFKDVTEEVRRWAEWRPSDAGPPHLQEPRIHGDLYAIREGTLRIRSLRIVDNFGRIQDVSMRPVRASTTLAYSNVGGQVFLPPRALQPMRVEVRWLSGHDEESALAHGHPATSPVLGWLVASSLEQKVNLYTPTGTPCGRLVADQDGLTHLEAVPNDVDVHVREAFQTLVGVEHDAFLAHLVEAESRIEPGQTPSNAFVNILESRPIALVEAQISLRLSGEPDAHQGMPEFLAAVGGGDRLNSGITETALLVRLGEPERFEDGLIAVHADAAEDGSRQWAMVHATAPVRTLRMKPGQSVRIKMLVDPHAVVHVVTGVLPTKALALPSHHASWQLDRLEMAFEVGPVLCEAGAHQVDLPLPELNNLAWSWTDHDGASAEDERPVEPITDAGLFHTKLELREGLLRLRRTS